MNPDEFQRLFIYSKMLIINDADNGFRYKYHEYLEFQEFICRLAAAYNPDVATLIHIKVYRFMEMLCNDKNEDLMKTQGKFRTVQSDELYKWDMVEESDDDDKE